MKTRSAKSKGKKFQNEIRDILTKEFGWEEGDCESRSMGSSGVDLMLSPRARRDFPVSVECKKTKAHPSRAAVTQSQANSYAGTIGGVVWAPHRCGPSDALIMFDLSDFIKWYKGLKNEVQTLPE